MRTAKTRRAVTPGFLTCGRRVGQARSPDAAMTSGVPRPACKGIWAWQKVADNSINRAGSSVCTLAVFRLGALADAASSGRKNIGSGSLYIERIGLLGLTGQWGLASSGDRAPRGQRRGLASLAKVSAVPTLPGWEQKARVKGHLWADPAALRLAHYIV